MGFFDFLITLIVLVTVGSVGVTYLAGRTVWRAGKRLSGWMRERKLLESGQRATQEAQDVVVEPVEAVQDVVDVSPQQVDYVRLDVESGCTPDKVIEVMSAYVSDPVMGERAEAVIQTMRSLKRRRQSLAAELDGTFQHGSLSWEKFAGPINAALDSLMRNSALLGNRIQAFDSTAYVRLFKSVQRDQMGGEHAGYANRAERLRLYQEMLASIDALQETNDALLLELDKLASELGDIQRDGGSAAESATLDEIRRLVDEAKYYRSH